MDATAPLPELDDQQPTWDKGAAVACHWDLTRLADRLEKLSILRSAGG